MQKAELPLCSLIFNSLDSEENSKIKIMMQWEFRFIERLDILKSSPNDWEDRCTMNSFCWIALALLLTVGSLSNCRVWTMWSFCISTQYLMVYLKKKVNPKIPVPPDGFSAITIQVILTFDLARLLKELLI